MGVLVYATKSGSTRWVELSRREGSFEWGLKGAVRLA